MYFSLFPTPGYNNSYLKTSGIDGEWQLFGGDLVKKENGSGATWAWGGRNHSIEVKLDFVKRECGNHLIIFFRRCLVKE